MTPTDVAVLLMLAFAVDVISIGPAWIRDRLAFFGYLAGIYEGFNGSIIDRWTLDRLKDFVEWGLARTGDAYIAGALPAVIIGVLVGAVYAYGVACMVPRRASKFLGPYAGVFFPGSGMWRVNWKLFAVAAVLALFGDVPAGWIGTLTAGTNDFVAGFLSPLPEFLTGGR